MADEMDRVQQHVERETAAALAMHAARTPVRAGRTTCERHDCGEAIDPQRTIAGGRLCRECQDEHDKRNAHFARWAQR